MTPRKVTATSGERYRDGLGWSTAARNCDQAAHNPLPLADPSFRFDVAEKGSGPRSGRRKRVSARPDPFPAGRTVPRRPTSDWIPSRRAHAQHGAAGVGAQQSSRKFEALEQPTEVSSHEGVPGADGVYDIDGESRTFDDLFASLDGCSICSLLQHDFATAPAYQALGSFARVAVGIEQLQFIGAPEDHVGVLGDLAQQRTRDIGR